MAISPGTLPMYNFIPLLIREAKGIIAVEGLTPNENLFTETQNSYLQIINFFLACKAARPAGTVDIDRLVQSDANKILNVMNSITNAHSVVTIYILAHGNIHRLR